jgi:hypothetical protein
MDSYHLRQGLHVIASSWDYHGGAESRVSVRGNSDRFNVGAQSDHHGGTFVTTRNPPLDMLDLELDTFYFVSMLV